MNVSKVCYIIYVTNTKIYPLAKELTSNLYKSLRTPSRSVKISKNFYVLKHTKIPALLIEIESISSLEIENLIKDNNYIGKDPSSKDLLY